MQREDAPAAPAKASRKPRAPSKGKAALEAWCAAVKAVTGVPSAERGKVLEGIAATLQDTIAESGDTFEDVVRRRVEFGKSLQVRWAAQDYTSDKTRKAPAGAALKSGDRSNWDRLNENNQAGFKAELAKYQRWNVPPPPPTPEEEAELDRIFAR